MKYHYRVTDLDNDIILDSGRREDFEGYSSFAKAYEIGLGARMENRLDANLHFIEVYPAFREEDIPGNDALPQDNSNYSPYGDEGL